MADTQIPSLNIACRLMVGTLALHVGQICRDVLILDSDVDLPPCPAKLIVQVDGKCKVYGIFLPHGVSKGVEATPFY